MHKDGITSHGQPSVNEEENPPKYQPSVNDYKGVPSQPYSSQPHPEQNEAFNQQPQQGFFPHNTTMFSPSPIFVSNVLYFSTHPMYIICQHCHAQILTSTLHTSGVAVWLISILICILGGFLGCCLLPFCIDGLKDVEHMCPNCGKVCGVCRRF